MNTVYIHTCYGETFGHTNLMRKYTAEELIAQAIRLHYYNATMEDFIIEHMHDNHYMLIEVR